MEKNNRDKESMKHKSPLDVLYSDVGDSVDNRSTVATTSRVDGDIASRNFDAATEDFISKKIKDALDEPMELLKNIKSMMATWEADKNEKPARRAHTISSSESMASEPDDNVNNNDDMSEDDLEMLHSSTDVKGNSAPEEPAVLYPDHLEGLFDLVNDETGWGPEVSENLANFLNAFLNRIPPKKCMLKIEAEKDSILVPSNCKGLLVPLCNSFVWEVLKSNTIKSNEKKLQNIQISFVKGLIPLARVLDNMCTSQIEERSRELIESCIISLKISM